jgi:hypothetical protein
MSEEGKSKELIALYLLASTMKTAGADVSFHDGIPLIDLGPLGWKSGNLLVAYRDALQAVSDK